MPPQCQGLTADDKKLVFTYDYLNRRVRKVVYAWDPNEGESGDWSATAELDLRYIYHERLLLLELEGGMGGVTDVEAITG